MSENMTMSNSKRMVLILIAALEIVWTSMAVFGWAPLKVLLQRERIYSELCFGAQDGCAAQEHALAFIYTVGCTASCFGPLIFGVVLDKCGPRLTVMCGSATFFIGTLIFAFSGNDTLIGDMFCIGYALMGIGGGGIVYPMMHLSNLLPSYSGTILVIFNVMIDASSGVFVILEGISRLGVSLKMMFVGYSIIPALILFTAPCLWESKSYPEPVREDVAPLAPLISFIEQVKTPEYVCGLVFTAFQMFRFNVYIGTLNDCLQEKLVPPSGQVGDSAEMSTWFGWILPIGGVVSCYFVGRTIDNASLTTNVCVVCVLTVLYSILCFASEWWLIIVSFVTFSYARAAFYGVMCAYVSFVFGFRHFGKIYGSMVLLGGLICLKIPAVDDMITMSHSLTGVNIFLLLLSVTLSLFPVWMYFRPTFSMCRRPGENLSQKRKCHGREDIIIYGTLTPDIQTQ